MIDKLAMEDITEIRSKVLTRPCKPCRTKNFTFIGVFIFHAEVKIYALVGEGLVKQLKKEWEDLLQGLGD